MKKTSISPSWFIERAAILAQDNTANECTERKVDVFKYLSAQLGKPFTDRNYYNLRLPKLLPKLDQPHGQGQGPGKEPRLWTPREVHMLLGLCAIDDWYDERPSSAVRAQIPVWLWLYAGDQFHITVEDIQKIMVLWAEKERYLSQKNLQQTSIELIKWIGEDASEGTRAVKQNLHELYEAVHGYYYSGDEDPSTIDVAKERLYNAIKDLQDNLKGKLFFPKHPPEYVEHLKQGLRYLSSAIVNYENCLYLLHPKNSPDSFDKAVWHWARYFYHDQQLPPWFQPLDVELVGTVRVPIDDLLRNSCLALAQCLMIACDPLLTQSLPEQQQPELWIHQHGITQTLPFSFSKIDDESFRCKGNLYSPNMDLKAEHEA